MSGFVSPTRSRRLAASTTGLAALIALSGCGAVAAPSEPPEPVTLRLIHIDTNPALDPAVSGFIEEVAQASDGHIEIELVGMCCGTGADNEQVVVSKIADGEAALGIVASRAFDVLGVDDLQALSAPLLLDSYALQESVITSDFARERLGGLTELGVTGIALLPGPIRVPLSSANPLLGPEDWAGLRVHTVASALSGDAFAALGSSAVSLDVEGRDTGLLEGSIQATDNGYAFQRGDRERILPYATVNVGLWPRVSALIGHPASLTELSDAQRTVLTDAAAAVAARTDDLAALDAATVAEACERGARYAEASVSQLAALEAAFEPVYASLEKDAETAEFIERIRELESSIDAEPPVAIPDGCTGLSPLIEATGDGEGGDVTVVNGRWTRDAMTIDELVAGGMTQAQAQDGTAQFALEFTDGAFSLHVEGEWVCDGEVAVTADRLVVEYLPGGFCGPGGLLFEATFAIDGDTMTLSDVDSQNDADKIFFGLRPWTRIG